MVESLSYKYHNIEGTQVTACWSFLPNGFCVGYGESSCVDPKNFDFDLGKKYAKERCLRASTDKLWEFEGYSLKHKES